jgi:hypothetical protein
MSSGSVIRSITQVGTSEPFELQVARGQIPGHRFVHRQGRVPTMSNNTTGTVWDVNDTLYPWSAWDTAGTITITRADAADANKSVIVSGLDADYNPVSTTITLTNASGNTSSTVFKRLDLVRMNGTSTNVGDITVLKGATTVGKINAGVGQSLKGTYTVPAGFTAYLTQGVMTIQNGADGSGTFYYRVPGDRFLIGHTFEVASAEYHYGFTCPFALPEKSDIDVRVSVRTNNALVTAAYDIILIKNQGGL